MPYTENSDSNNGSDVPPGDTYLPRTADGGSHDDSYDPEYMEMDGKETHAEFVSKLHFHYEPLDTPLVEPTTMYDGDGPCLRRGVRDKFHTAFECVQVCGGLNLQFFKRLATNSSSYARTHQKADKTFVGYAWNNITTEKRIRFNGMVLKCQLTIESLVGTKHILRRRFLLAWEKATPSP